MPIIVKKIKAIVVEDEIIIGNSIKRKIEEVDKDFEIIGLAKNGLEALELIKKLKPKVVFTDICMPILDGRELARKIREQYPNVLVVIISGFSDFSYAQESIKYGVFNYLLKPLEEDILSETLFGIKKSLAYRDAKQNRQIIYSDLYDITNTEDEKYAICLVGFGNIVYDLQDEEVKLFYIEHLDKIPWKELLNDIISTEASWYVADEQFINQKIIGVKCNSKTLLSNENLINRIHLKLQEYCDNLPINIVFSKSFLIHEEVWNVTKRMRNVLKQNYILGSSNLWELEDNEYVLNNDMLEIVKIKLSSYVKNYINSGDLKKFLDEVYIILKYMFSKPISQDSIEKVSMYILKLMEFSKQDYETTLLQGLNDEITRTIALAMDKENLIEDLMNIFRKVESSIKGYIEPNIEKQILQYIDDNYLTIDSLEHLSDIFGYNYAYLSRLFKKKVGVPMNKYITEKKLAMAKELMKNNNLNIAEISDMCGYNDYRYFSRVFKGEEGLTPSEYRQLIGI